MVRTARLEVRVRPESKARIEHAAALVHAPVSDFVRRAVEERTEQVMVEYDAHTRVPAEFFDELLDALDAPIEASGALARAARRARDAVTRG